MLARSAPIGVAFAAALVLASALTGCAQPATDPTTAPSASQPDASAAPAPSDSSAAPSAEPSGDPGADAGTTWETQDGAMRLRLPEGWSVDDRSAMGEASQMYDRGPGWLNDVVLLDEGGDQMLWYREYYGDDAVVCADREWPLEVPIDPYGPGLDGEDLAPVLIVGEAGPATDFTAEATPGAGAARMALQARLAQGDCGGFDESIWVGDRVVLVDAVADAPGAEQPDPIIRFADEQSARAWLDGDEAAMLIDVLSSIELTGAPMLDAAP